MESILNICEPALLEAPRARTRSELLRGVRSAIPVLFGFLPFALVLGAQAAQKGLGAVELPLMTGLNFAGGSEFAAIQLWTSPPHVLLIVAITFLVNSRHLLMGAALTPFIRHLPRRKALAVLFLMCDESWAMGLADARRRTAAGERCPFSLPYYAGVALSMYLAWVTFTAIGGLVGPFIGDVRAWGFDMAFPAVFLVLLRGMWTGWRAARPWGISLVAAGVVHLLAPGAWYVAAGALSGVVAAWFLAGSNR
jgi:4-azaleucine resistance transporter AzlC